MLIHPRPTPASLAQYCQLAPEEIAHLEPQEREPLDQLAVKLQGYKERARTKAEERKYTHQQQTLRELVRDPSLSPQARASVLNGWASTPAPGYWLATWEQLTGTSRDQLYCQAENLLSMIPQRMRQGLEALPAESSVNVCRSMLGARWAPPPDAGRAELAAAALTAHCLGGVAFRAHASRMLKGLFQADMPPTYRQRSFELVGERLHALRMGGNEDYVAQVNQVLDREGLDAEVRVAVLEQLSPGLDVDGAIEAASVRHGVSKTSSGIQEATSYVALNGIVLRKRVL